MQVGMPDGSQSMVKIAPQPEVWYVGSEDDGKGVIIRAEEFLGGDGYPLLLRAAAENRPDEVEALIKQGADIRTRNARNKNVLHVAAHAGHIEVIKRLLDLGSRVNAKSDFDWWTGWGTTALHEATHKGHVEYHGQNIDTKQSYDVIARGLFFK